MQKLIDTLGFTLERLRQHRLLVMWVLVGLVTATTLALSLSLYIDAVYTDVLQTRLSDPPYAFRLRYLGAWNGNITAEDVTRAEGVIHSSFTQTIGLPVKQAVQFLRGGSWGIRLSNNVNLGAYGVGTLTGAESQMTISAGTWDSASTTVSEDGVIPVMLPETMLYTMGLQVGDTLSATPPGSSTPVTLQVVALWTPINADDPSWVFPPKYFDNIIIVRPSDFQNLIVGLSKPIDETAWYLNFDGASVRTSDVNTLLGAMTDGLRVVEATLPGIRVDLSPREPLEAFNAEVRQLTAQLVIIIAPVGGLVLYFVSLVAGLLVNRQGNEDVKLRSRGISRRRLLAIHFLLWLLLIGIALGLGVAISPLLVNLIGRTTSFLRFDSPSSVHSLEFTTQALLFGGVTGLLAASSGLFMAWRTTGQNINSYRQMNLSVRAWWQRMYLDLMLLVPALYMLYALWAQGGLVASSDTPFSDPLAFAVPTLFALGAALLILRVFPFVLRLLSGLVNLTTSIAMLMALRELTRSIGRYRGALLMMAFTLSLTGFTASMASTLDQSLSDSIDYTVGADLVVVTAIDAQTELNSDGSYTVIGYNAPPIEDMRQLDGIESASRVGRYTGRLRTGNQVIEGTLLGVDRWALGVIARFRQDYADEPLGNLLNRLAKDRTGILINRQTAELYNLVEGQEVTIGLFALETWYETRVRVIGILDYFPTLDPADGFFAVTNIDPLHELAGTSLPYDAWVALADHADIDTIYAELLAINYPVLRLVEPETALTEARAEPSRRGVLGFLSVGFVASTVLTLIAAVIQSTASFRAQSQQLGALRAMGLNGASVGEYLMLVQSLSALGGIAGGTGIGVLTTMLFLPLLDFSGGLPPYLVRVSWDEIAVVYAVFTGVLFAVTLLTTIMLSREQLSTIVRLGEG